MDLSRIDRISLFNRIKEETLQYSPDEINMGIMQYCLSYYGYSDNKYSCEVSKALSDIFSKHKLPYDLEIIIEFFESLLEGTNKDENGIVFTPKYIAEYIVKETLGGLSHYEPSLSIIDPGCGCGIFLLTAIEYVVNRFDVSVDTVVHNNIFGFDIEPNNAIRCSLILTLLIAKNGGDYENITPNILCRDSLKTNWNEAFSRKSFNFIIGNPPYVNPHDMNKDTVSFLKNNFVTTKGGVFNIFYAFIEKSMSFLDENGEVGFIVPNNFLSIKSAIDLREFLQTNKYVKKILDFADNMVFKPVRTYNCIIILTRKIQEILNYYVMNKVEDIEDQLKVIQFSQMNVTELDKNGWKLVDEKTRRNISKIESQLIPIKDFIRTGIATLRDGVYLVDSDTSGFFKVINGKKHYIEDGLVKPIYKIPELKSATNFNDVKRYIIFPYIKSDNGYQLIDEIRFKTDYPQTYEALAIERAELDMRDKGKGVAQGWYAYGRTQGLNKYGKKLLFPTFSNEPRFTYVDNEDALFCNGYAVFENDKYDLLILQKLLNSRVMYYYVSNTSYSIEGGYYCYQKKYIEKFSLPLFSDDEIEFIKNATPDELDSYLWTYYNLE